MKEIIQEIRDRLYKKNQNWLSIICGATGSGKSYSALKFATEIDPEFTVSTVRERVVFTPQQFMALLNSGTLKEGSCIIWDEAGVGIPAREWQSISNKLINYITQTFRTDNLAVIFTTPSFEFVDTNLRKLFHAYIETMHIDRYHNVCIVKYKKLQYNPWMKKSYAKYPITMTGKLNEIAIRKPSAKMCHEYDAWRDVYSKELKTDVETKLGLKENGNKEDDDDTPKCIQCGRTGMYWTKDGNRCRRCGHMNPHFNVVQA